MPHWVAVCPQPHLCGNGISHLQTEARPWTCIPPSCSHRNGRQPILPSLALAFSFMSVSFFLSFHMLQGTLWTSEAPPPLTSLMNCNLGRLRRAQQDTRGPDNTSNFAPIERRGAKTSKKGGHQQSAGAARCIFDLNGLDIRVYRSNNSKTRLGAHLLSLRAVRCILEARHKLALHAQHRTKFSNPPSPFQQPTHSQN